MFASGSVRYRTLSTVGGFASERHSTYPPTDLGLSCHAIYIVGEGCIYTIWAIYVPNYGFGLDTVDYQDTTEGPYSHEWKIDPMPYQGLRITGYSGMSYLVAIAKDLRRGSWQGKE